MTKRNCGLFFLLLFCVIFTTPVFSQGTDGEVISEPIADDVIVY